MIHHLSIPASDPQRVAGVLAELFGGVCIPFPPIPGAFIALAQDRHGTAVEVYPADGQLKPNGDEGAEFVRSGQAATPGAVHFALSVDRDLASIEAIARREGWALHVCDRGGDFGVVEFWVENRFMIELLPPDFAARYLAFTGRFIATDKPADLMASHQRPVPA